MEPKVIMGLIKKSMYGLRDAPQICQDVVRDMLEARGFSPLGGTQCMYVHAESRMVIVAQVDDLFMLGLREELKSLLANLQRDYECTGQIMGDQSGDVAFLKFLGRRISLTKDGIEREGDRKHVLDFLLHFWISWLRMFLRLAAMRRPMAALVRERRGS